MTPEAKKAYELYTDPRMGNTRLMELIFKNPDIVKEVVDEGQFSYYLMKMGLFQLNINYNQSTYLMTLFDTDDLYLMWQIVADRQCPLVYPARCLQTQWRKPAL